MIDLHCHILPGMDDGAADLVVSLEMARAFAADGVAVVACTPHILPGVYANSVSAIREQVGLLQAAIDAEGIPLSLVIGADNHITSSFVADLRAGLLLALGDTRYVLVEPPHHVAPPRMANVFFDLLLAGYVPILTHPERLAYIGDQYDLMRGLVHRGVWMQITAGSLAGRFGSRACYWAERMLEEGLVHIIATDAHDLERRPPNLGLGRELAAKRVGEEEARNLVQVRPAGILASQAPASLPQPISGVAGSRIVYTRSSIDGDNEDGGHARSNMRRLGGSFAGRLRRIFK
jgi:protein-tyrosine phosphatase